jgi:hypothetical protein
MVQCNRDCGARALTWKIVNGKYKLFGKDNFIHMCNDGETASKAKRQKATAKILDELGIREVSKIPDAEVYTPPEKEETRFKKNLEAPLFPAVETETSKMFTINTTATGVAITGDDKHNAIYLPKVALPELVKALMDFI